MVKSKHRVAPIPLGGRAGYTFSAFRVSPVSDLFFEGEYKGMSEILTTEQAEMTDMPGFDRDWVNGLIAAVPAPAPVDAPDNRVTKDALADVCRLWDGLTSGPHDPMKIVVTSALYDSLDRLAEMEIGKTDPAPPESPLISTLRYLISLDLPKAVLLDRLVKAVRDANTTVDGRALTAAEMRK